MRCCRIVRGQFLVAWFILSLILLAAPRAQAAFTPPVAVNTDALSDSLSDAMPAMACDGKGTWVTVWQRFGPNLNGSYGNDPASGTPQNEDLFFARSTDNGQAWSAPAELKTNAATDEADDLEPAITTDGKGVWMVVWRSLDSLGGTIGYDADILMTVSTDNGVTWSAPAPVNTDAATDSGGFVGDTHNAWDYRPNLASDGQGHWVATWIRSDNRSGAWVNSVLKAVSSDNGAHWSMNALATRTDSDINTYPQTVIACDHNKRWLVAWSERTAMGADIDLYFRSSDDNGASWSTTARLNTNGASDSGDDAAPSLATDGQGHWLAAWHSTDSLGGTLGTDNDILYATSSDNGQTWSAPAALNTDAATDGSGSDAGPQAIYDGLGNWVVGWGTDKLGGDSDLVYATSPIAAVNWTAAQPVNPWATTDSGAVSDLMMKMTSDGQGHWRALWSSAYAPGSGYTGGELDLFTTLYPASVPVELSRFRAE